MWCKRGSEWMSRLLLCNTALCSARHWVTACLASEFRLKTFCWSKTPEECLCLCICVSVQIRFSLRCPAGSNNQTDKKKVKVGWGQIKKERKEKWKERKRTHESVKSHKKVKKKCQSQKEKNKGERECYVTLSSRRCAKTRLGLLHYYDDRFSHGTD